MSLLSADIEKELTDRIRRGEASAMKMLYDRFCPYLNGVCSRYMDNDDDVKDVLQDVFVKIFTRFDSFTYRGSGSLQAWVKRIAVNESLMLLKTRKRANMVHLEGDIEEEPAAEPNADEVPAEKVMEMIRSLPQQYRTVFNLYVFEDKSHKEIASLLHIKEDTSASDLHRAKKMLSDMIARYRNARQL